MTHTQIYVYIYIYILCAPHTLTHTHIQRQSNLADWPPQPGPSQSRFILGALAVLALEDSSPHVKKQPCGRTKSTKHSSLYMDITRKGKKTTATRKYENHPATGAGSKYLVGIIQSASKSDSVLYKIKPVAPSAAFPTHEQPDNLPAYILMDWFGDLNLWL